MKLSELLKQVKGLKPAGKAEDFEVKALCDDSRLAAPGSVFLALPSASGAAKKPAAFEKEAASKGALVLKAGKDPRADWARLCSAFYGNPSDHLTLVGITGTNGKTTTAYLTRSVLAAAGKKSGLIGTVVYDLLSSKKPASNTTPGSLELLRMVSSLRTAGADACVMEVSSHALDQKRADGLRFDAGVFTNLTQDHLDYHKTMPAYGKAKSRLFKLLKSTGVAVVNLDDPSGPKLAASRPKSATLVTYSASGKPADLRASGLKFSATETRFTLFWQGKGHALVLPLPGRFNVDNALAAAGAALGLGVSMDTVLKALAKPQVPPGRFELVRAGQDFQVVVDYAHTPDALERLIKAAREITPGRIITVFGCGGDRDKTKRPLMGRIAAELSDLVLVTSDNPRSEDPEKILDGIFAGMSGKKEEIKTVLRQPDRAKAISRAIKLAKKGDTVLLAGKGHEDYQVLKQGKIHFSDIEQARAAIQARLG